MAKEIAKQEPAKQRTIKDISTTELESIGFRHVKAINQLQAELNAIEAELAERAKNTKSEG
jgi:hypothetical protein